MIEKYYRSLNAVSVSFELVNAFLVIEKNFILLS